MNLRNKFILLIIIFLLFSAFVHAQTSEVSQEIFAKGITVEFDQNKGKLFKFSLPEEFYKAIYNPALEDMVLLNKSGETVPFTIVAAQPDYYYTPPEKEAVYFTTTSTYKNDNKQDIEYVSAIIVDLSLLKDNNYEINKLRFSFNADKNFDTNIVLYTSQTDLSQWSKTNWSNIAFMKASNSSSDDAQVLVKDFIYVSLPQNTKYIKIETEGLGFLQYIDKVYVNYKQILRYNKAEKTTVSASLKDNKTEAEFVLSGYYPLEWVHFNIDDSYLFPNFSLFYKNFHDYNIFSNKALEIYDIDNSINGAHINIKAKNWLLKTQSGLPSNNWTADFYWRAEEVIFLTKGEGPYTLAFGSVTYRNKNMAEKSQIMPPNIEPIAIKAISEAFIIAGDEAYNLPEPEIKSNMSKYILIGIMILVVLALTLVTLRLIKDINKNK